MDFRPFIIITTTQPYTGLYPFGEDIYGKPVDPLSIHTTGGQGPNREQGEASLTVQATLSPKEDSELELPGRRLLIAKAVFRVKTDLGHVRKTSQAHVMVWCGDKPVVFSDIIHIPGWYRSH
ncbi:hypothetical protein [Oligoflexus tunisiensis]|uniref:hypothetical protein n=1 Tax=Oligoflexus tunisiensis TaxID=708132 RepID=UPI00114C8A4A|nr:hypothetical protein [Oligoflexus tunisiensis]